MTKKRPSQLDRVTQTVMLNHKDLSTYEVACRHASLQGDVDGLTSRIEQLQADLKVTLRKRRELMAAAEGLEQIINGRN